MASALITSIVVAAAFVTLRERIDANVRAVFVRELREREHDVSALRRERLRLLLATSSLVSTSPTLRAALRHAQLRGRQRTRLAGSAAGHHPARGATPVPRRRARPPGGDR